MNKPQLRFLAHDILHMIMRSREAVFFFLFFSDFRHIAAFVGGQTRLYHLHAMS
jgi:hypothetical protein